ncbi:MAG: hypothetical protein ABSF09_03330 [Candidatus Bathyarchaeia archaeon]
MENRITIATPRYSAHFDHNTVVAGLTRTYGQRGIAVKSEPALPGGKKADLALRFNDGWTYIEVKTRNEKRSRNRNISFRQGILRELMRLGAHSLKQLPRKESSLVVLSTSPSPDRREAISKITIARSFRWRIFKEKNDRVIGVMIFAPFRSPKKSPTGWRYASTLIPNPNWDNPKGRFEKLMSVQL